MNAHERRALTFAVLAGVVAGLALGVATGGALALRHFESRMEREALFVCPACDGRRLRAWQLARDGQIMSADGEAWLVSTGQNPKSLPCDRCNGAGYVTGPR